MIVKPSIWGFISTTAHPLGCALNVRDQIDVAHASGLRTDGPRRVLVIGASTGYGLAARITAAFGFDAATLGVFLEKPGRYGRTATAGWYHAAAFEHAARATGRVSISLNGDAFAESTRSRAIDLIRTRLGGPVDLVVYSLAAPARYLPQTGGLAYTSLKPIGRPYTGRSIDTDRDVLTDVHIEPATPREVEDTIAVMGGENWLAWMEALQAAGMLAAGARTVAFSYIGPEETWPLYWNGAIGAAKRHLETTARDLNSRLAAQGVQAHVAIMKSIVTQASAAVPVMPLYVSIVSKVMQEFGLEESAIEQAGRLFHERLYRADGALPALDAEGRIRLDEREMRGDVQQACKALWSQVNDHTLLTLTDYAGYKHRFLRQFGFARDDVDYEVDVSTEVAFDCVTV